uniref:uncharacterized protein LOC109961469 isoform X2 n=1 Tax=Monopterus albus TaxID=43700 RepID=UPI0009B39E55|nr:uncharacterized protein LOC109961469 isoform X2 [Monopterus albus]
MDIEYPALRRPKRKLCYLTDNTCSSKQCAGIQTLEDVDRMFDFDSSAHDKDILDPSPRLQMFDTDQSEKTSSFGRYQMGPEGDAIPELGNDLDIPLHEPVKTSSPIDENNVVKEREEEEEERALVVPSVFFFEDEEKEAAETQPVNIQMPQRKEHITEKQEMKENVDLLVPAGRPGPKLQTSDNNLGRVSRQPSAVPTGVGKHIEAFLQKVREAALSKPACSRRMSSPVKASTPPEPEDEFLIIEDDGFCFSSPHKISIPHKTLIIKTQKKNESKAEQSSTNKDGLKNSPLENAEKEEKPEKTNTTLDVHPVGQKTKHNDGKDRRTRKGKGTEVTEPGNNMVDLSIPEDVPASDFVGQEKQQLKKVPFEESDKAEEEPKDRDGRNKPKKMEKKTRKSSQVKSSKSSRDLKENVKTSRAKLLEKTRKVMQGSEDIKEMVCVDTMKERNEEQSSKEQADAEGLDSLSEGKQNKLSAVSEGSLSEDGHVLGKRKRKPLGQRWLNSPQTPEETKDTDNYFTFKKSKWNNKNHSAAGKATKDQALVGRNQKQTVSSSQSTDTAKKWRTKLKKNIITGGERPDNMKETEVFHMTKEKQLDDQDQEVPDQDPDWVQMSFNSGNRVFPRVYHPVANEKLSKTQVPISVRRPQGQLKTTESEKRRRKPPGNWWVACDVSQDRNCISPQPQQLRPKEPKPKKREKHIIKSSSALGTPKKGNTAVSSQPLRGAPVLPTLQLSAPKTVKSSPATFKDIFTSSTEAMTVVGSRDARQNSRCHVITRPAEEVTFVLSNQKTPQDINCQSENTLKDLISGPSSMIELEEYEECDDLVLASSRTYDVLCASDLCAPPLKPLILHPEDEASLRQWFKNLWSTPVHSAAEISPNQFDWYIYREKAIGLLVDLNSGFVCSGRIFLGSYAKKPLFVDHSALTVFKHKTSSVNVIIDGTKSCFNAGHSFMVKCGHAYSIQNVTAQPAVLYFTRILTESSD